MVQLVPGLSAAIAKYSLSFQFHYGSISSCRCYILNSKLTEFQFHYGSISSEAALIEAEKYPDFNSTMVQLVLSLLAQ